MAHMQSIVEKGYGVPMNKSLMIVTEAFVVGGVETYIRTEVEELSRQGWSVHLVCGREFSPMLVPDCVASVTHGLALGAEATVSEFLDVVDQLLDIARRNGITVIHAHPFTSLVSALVCAQLVSVPMLVTLHGPSSVVGSYGAGYDFMVASLVLPAASGVMAVSQEVRDLAMPYVEGQRLFVFPNAVASIARVERKGNGRWLLVSRLDSSKIPGVQDFVGKLLGMSKRVDICGSGPAQGRLEAEFSDAIGDGRLRLLDPTPAVQQRMGEYDGVAGMGRVALEGLVQGMPVVLVGYDGVKGMLDLQLFEGAAYCNFSGRGLPTIGGEQLQLQLRDIPIDMPDLMAAAAIEKHDPKKIWGDFSRLVQTLGPVDFPIIAELADHLRAAHPDSAASAYWSQEMMDSLSKVVAGGATADPRLQASLTLFSNTYSRVVFERELKLLKQEQHEGMADIQAAVRQCSIEAVDDVKQSLDGLRDTAQVASAERAELLRRCLVDELEAVRGQVESSVQSHREAGIALSREISELEEKLENSLTRMESEIKHDLQGISGGLEHGKLLGQEVRQLLERVEMLEAELDAVYASSSWAVTRPFRFLKRLVVQPRATYRLLRGELGERRAEEAGGGHRRGILRRAFSLTERTVRTGRLDPSDKARLVAMVRNGYSAVAHSLGVAEISQRPVLAAADGQADVFVWSVIDWHFRMQRPQHLAAAMAGKGHRVFYISNNFVDSSTSGFAIESLDENGRLFQVNLHVKGAPQIYSDLASPEQVDEIRRSLAELLVWAGTNKSISLVQHPFWIEPAQSLPNMQLVYDCMDHHGGFENNAGSVLAGEKLLVERADLLIVTSQWLLDEMSSRVGATALIRNATEYEHFCSAPGRVFTDAKGRRVIGYYGAIAEWFDVELVRRIAIEHPDALVVLVGRDTAKAQERLAGVENIEFVGEVSYDELPFWVHGFDVCLLPFLVIPLTLATNPVKVYEYLSAGKPVVSVDLPEMAQFKGLVELAESAEEFSVSVGRVLANLDQQLAQKKSRQDFAARQTWAHRAADLDVALSNIEEPRVSVIVLCYNNVEFTEACLASLEKYSDYPNLEVIAVDNASSDTTPEMLTAWQKCGPNRIHIANAANLGFSAGNNVGLQAATGDYLVILNNDTYVTPGWVRSMFRHLRHKPAAGLVGPVTNNIGNEARIEISYACMEEMIEKAGCFTRKHPGVVFPIATAAFFCVMMTRAAYEKVGPMDEAFGVGFFEDDDYCRRLALEGFEVLCAEDVFVHHHLSASFNKLKAESKQKLFETNKAIFEAKWGKWEPHAYKERPPY